MFSSQYLTYIHSSAWKVRRERALSRAGFRCQVCGARSRLQVHHVTYANLGHEADEDLTVMCWVCHLWITWMLRLRRFWKWFWN
jgi:5-methylcytosine-specific restriction endonuclease McrA